jgi:hypothetical protein
MFELYGNLHDKELIKLLQGWEKSNGLKPQSESGIRSRRSELSSANDDALDEIAEHLANTAAATFLSLSPELQTKARDILRIEGFRSPLWLVGVTSIDGRRVGVWGVAK